MFKVYVVLVAAWVGLIGWAGVTGVLPAWVLLGFGVVSVVTLGYFWLDKSRAQREGARRIPERLLHALELLGGWPASLLGQKLFRHKTTKRIYQYQFALMVAAHLAGLIAYLFWTCEPPPPDSLAFVRVVGRLLLESPVYRVVGYYIAVQLLSGALGLASTLGLISPERLKSGGGSGAGFSGGKLHGEIDQIIARYDAGGEGRMYAFEQDVRSLDARSPDWRAGEEAGRLTRHLLGHLKRNGRLTPGESCGRQLSAVQTHPVIELLRSIGPPAIPDVTAALNEHRSNAEVLHAVIKVLCKVGPQAQFDPVPELIRAYRTHALPATILALVRWDAGWLNRPEAGSPGSAAVRVAEEWRLYEDPDETWRLSDDLDDKSELWSDGAAACLASLEGFDFSRLNDADREAVCHALRFDDEPPEPLLKLIHKAGLRSPHFVIGLAKVCGADLRFSHGYDLTRELGLAGLVPTPRFVRAAREPHPAPADLAEELLLTYGPLALPAVPTLLGHFRIRYNSDDVGDLSTFECEAAACACRVLWAVGPEVIPTLIGTLAAPPQAGDEFAPLDYQLWVIDVLGRFGEAAKPAVPLVVSVLAGLKSSDHGLVRWLLEVIHQSNPDAVGRQSLARLDLWRQFDWDDSHAREVIGHLVALDAVPDTLPILALAEWIERDKPDAAAVERLYRSGAVSRLDFVRPLLDELTDPLAPTYRYSVADNSFRHRWAAFGQISGPTDIYSPALNAVIVLIEADPEFRAADAGQFNPRSLATALRRHLPDFIAYSLSVGKDVQERCLTLLDAFSPDWYHLDYAMYEADACGRLYSATEDRHLTPEDVHLIEEQHLVLIRLRTLLEAASVRWRGARCPDLTAFPIATYRVAQRERAERA